MSQYILTKFYRNWMFLLLGLVLLLASSCAPQKREIKTQAGIVNRIENLNVHSPTWSPDGRTIAGVQDLSHSEPPIGYGDLILYDMSTGVVRKISDQHWGYSSPDKWSPDGTQIIAWGDEGQWLVSTIDGNAKYLTKGEGAAWSPDGQKLAIFRGPHSGGQADDWQITFVTPDGKELNTISAGAIPPPKPAPTPLPTEPGYRGPMPITASFEAYFTGMDWSPDGQSIVYSIVFPDESRGDLFIINVDGSGLRRLAEGRFIGEPVWSPKGDRIAYILSNDLITPNLFVTTPRGDCHLPLTQGGYLSDPSWSPDGRKLSVSAFTTIYILDVEKFMTDRYFDPRQCQQ